MKDKILIVYHYVAHYREAVFNYLCKKDSTSPYEYFIAAGELSNIPSIKLIDLERYPDISRNWVGLKNFWITKDVLWQKGLLKEIIRGKYKAIIFLGNMYFISTWIACFLCKMLRIKIYMWTHGLKYNEMGLRWLFRKFFYMLSDGLFLYGVRAKNILEAKGMNKKKLHIIYNSLDFEKQKKLYNDLIDKKKASFQKTASSKFERIIIYVGRITRDKKLDKAVLILSELNRYKKKYRLIFVGSGPEIGALKKLAENYNVLESIDFIGPCYDEVLLAKYIMLADVMLVPGDIGLTAIHAMTYGTPVVTHDKFDTHKPECEAIIDGETGSFVNIDDLETTMRHIEYWSKRKQANPSAMGEICRAKIDKYYNPIYQKKLIESVLSDTL